MTFKDTSSIECNNGKTIVLAHLYTVKHLHTWYMQHFNASFDNVRHQKNYDEFLQILHANHGIDFELFYERHVEPHSKSNKLRQLLQEVWQTTLTYHDFFVGLTNKYDCVVLSSWLYQFISSHLEFTIGHVYMKIDFDTNIVPIHVRVKKTKPAFGVSQQMKGGGLQLVFKWDDV